METKSIYPIFERMEPRSAKERLLSQRGVTLWFTGLSGSGKSTIAIALERSLSPRGHLCLILDGDGCAHSHGGEGQIATRIEAFVEMLEAEKEANA